MAPGPERAIHTYLDQTRQRYPTLNLKVELAEDGKLLPEQTRLALYRVSQQALV
jgi:hypothetical protein